ncbi:zinc ribbon domain-containing protein [Celerinatantimonas sp. MCCC 1A17872]|uniref:zinc ribbon domain-containing protein n=1 Tax=Celerinatantimonas sp. MCCC 1A17872 TaxID=3177514 RepID=UPI0038C3F7BD
MTALVCPNCERELEPSATDSHGGYCSHCQSNFHRVAYCPQCEQPLEVLKACGAVDYFCNHCNELKSKRQVIYRLEPKH